MYKAAAALNDTNAIQNLGLNYWKGQGVERDLSRAAASFRRCAPKATVCAAWLREAK